MEQMTRIQQNTLRKIVEAAIELMSEKGFHRVSVQEVGKKAGICEKDRLPLLCHQKVPAG